VAEKWDQPFPYGYPASAESAGSVAAPLLAGFSFALVGLVIPSPNDFRWPSAALLLLLAAGLAFIGAVQCWFWARMYAITPQDIDLWRPDYPAKQKLAIQRLHMRGFDIWSSRFNRFYRVGILLLLAGMTFTLVPRGDIGPVRSLAIALAAAGFIAELVWIAAIWLLKGSPVGAYDKQVDEPKEGVRFSQVRRSPILRRVARAIVPLPRIELPPPD